MTKKKMYKCHCQKKRKISLVCFTHRQRKRVITKHGVRFWSKNTKKKNMHAMFNLRVFFILIFYVYYYSFIYFCDNITFENPSIFINGFNEISIYCFVPLFIKGDSHNKRLMHHVVDFFSWALLKTQVMIMLIAINRILIAFKMNKWILRKPISIMFWIKFTSHLVIARKLCHNYEIMRREFNFKPDTNRLS